MEKSKFQEVDWYLNETKRSLELIKSASNSHDLRRSWESFVSNFGNAIGRMVSLGIRNNTSKAWAYRLKSLSTKDDAGLVYLREARNAAHHALEPFADFKEASVSLEHGGLGISLDEGHHENITFRDNIINGKKVVDGEVAISTEDGRITDISGPGKAIFTQRKSSIRLVEIYSTEKRKTYPVPKTILGKEIDSNNPQELAEEASLTLNDLVSELKAFY